MSIPKKLRDELSEDPEYKRCMLTNWNGMNIQFHHCYLYRKRQIQERWNIISVLKIMHVDKQNGGLDDSIHNCHETKEKAKWIAINRADIKELMIRYPKFNWQFEKDRLNQKFGERNK